MLGTRILTICRRKSEGRYYSDVNVLYHEASSFDIVEYKEQGIVYTVPGICQVLVGLHINKAKQISIYISSNASYNFDPDIKCNITIIYAYKDTKDMYTLYTEGDPAILTEGDPAILPAILPDINLNTGDADRNRKNVKLFKDFSKLFMQSITYNILKTIFKIQINVKIFKKVYRKLNTCENFTLLSL